MNENRTRRQENSYHLWFRMVAKQLNDAGMDMRACLKPDVEIPWSEESVKNHIWRPIQEILCDVESTTDLTTRDVDAIYQVISRHFAAKHGIQLPPFPDKFSQGLDT